MRYVIALDQGTTSSRAVIFNEKGEKIAACSHEFEQLYPQPGWVEHRPSDILKSQLDALKDAVAASNIDVNDVEAIGIANQRETALLWDRSTGDPLGKRTFFHKLCAILSEIITYIP